MQIFQRYSIWLFCSERFRNFKKSWNFVKIEGTQLELPVLQSFITMPKLVLSSFLKGWNREITLQTNLYD